MTGPDRLREATTPRDPVLRRLAERLGDDVAWGKLDLEGAFSILHAASATPVPDWEGIRACWLCRDVAHATGAALRRAAEPVAADEDSEAEAQQGA